MSDPKSSEILLKRRATWSVQIGSVAIGSDHPISIQSMLNTKTHDVESSLKQLRELEEEGCDIVRIAVPDGPGVQGFKELKAQAKVPLVADIHFDWRMAIRALEVGADGIRINPGNLGGEDKLIKVVEACRLRNVPIRVGVNGGSLEKDLLDKYGSPTPEAICESALRNIELLQKLDFRNFKVSMKSSDVMTTVKSHLMLAEKTKAPFHIGITESGTVATGSVKSTVGLSMLLERGLGDTMRVSLAGDPVQEVRVAKQILKDLGLRKSGITVVACPSCGRLEIDVDRLAMRLENRLRKIKEPITVSVLGCAVNGPGEAREADVGIAAGRTRSMIFRKGKMVRSVVEANLEEELIKEVHALIRERETFLS